MRRSALEHDALEERAMADGLELMRLLAEAHLACGRCGSSAAGTCGTLTATCA